ncbi:hypothetical protein BC941DRAFT_427601 [Chlamydoabsidia padenii]|nr:hypothetical protein BC941DRAFT_427601 [Chlamydoabsidia padenii]
MSEVWICGTLTSLSRREARLTNHLPQVKSMFWCHLKYITSKSKSMMITRHLVGLY